MRTVAAISQKGGVGKTTLLTSLAAVAAQAHEAVWIIDMDPQASAVRWGQERATNKKLPPVHVEAACTAKAFIRALANARRAGADLVLIDTPQGTKDEHYHAIGGAHVVLIPCRPNFFDANAILRTLGRVAQEKRAAFVMFTDVDAKAADNVAHASAGLSEHGARFAKLTMQHATDIALASELGQGVTEHAPKTKAAREMRAIALWVFAEAEKGRAALAKGAPSLEEQLNLFQTGVRPRKDAK